MDSLTDWNLCPTELLLIIFEMLDVRSLRNCMQVNKKWKDIAVKIVTDNGLWKPLVQKCLINMGRSYRQNSVLGWHDIYVNSMQWYDVKDAELIIDIFDYYQGTLKNLFVYRDNLILLTNFGVQYYNIESAVTTHSYRNKYEIYEETDHIILTKAVHDDVIMLYGKLQSGNHDCIQWTSICLENILWYRLEENKVFYFIICDIKSLYVHIWENNEWSTTVCGRYYDSPDIITGTLYNNDMYVVVDGGKTYRNNTRRLNFETYKMSNFSFPYGMTIKSMGIFDKNTLVITGDSLRKNFQCRYDRKINTVFLQCPGLTTALQHADVLFLGYKTGEVQIVIPLNMLKSRGKHELSFFVGKREPVIGLYVYETLNAHQLFVRTISCLHQVVIQFPNYVYF